MVSGRAKYFFIVASRDPSPSFALIATFATGTRVFKIYFESVKIIFSSANCQAINEHDRLHMLSLPPSVNEDGRSRVQLPSKVGL